jgi:transposase
MSAFYTKATLATRLVVSIDTVQRRLPEWRKQGMPAPLPWSRRQTRWDHDAIERWIERRERAAGAVPLELSLAS